jgi:shikimate dehydrogenase
VVARDAAKAKPLLALAAQVGVDAGWQDFTAAGLADQVAGAAAVVSTIPAGAAAQHVGLFERAPVLLDAIYDPWPTPLAAAVTAAGGTVISGLQMLLHQAFAQVEQFTGLPAPKDAMWAAVTA